MLNRHSGFTLIELLVVIAIIGTLSALLLPNLMGARERARDVQRKSDIHQIQRALELYKLDQNPPLYPTGIPAPNALWQNPTTKALYMEKVPGDPQTLTPSPYIYTINPLDYTKYTLTACLENPSDSNGTVCALCGGSGPGGISKLCYTINEP